MKPYLDCNGDPLVIGHLYHLVTYENEGYKKDPENWIKAIWNGTSLIDLDGCTWSEWLGHDLSCQEDIRPII